MAIQRHVDMLLHDGVTRWNLWRHEEPDVRPNLSEADLTGAHLSGAYLREADLTEANLTRANLSDADLTGAHLTGANLAGADLTGADLTGAYLSLAILARANLSTAHFTGAHLPSADLSGADLSGANLSGANLTLTILREANLTGAYLRGANLTRANLSEANLAGADLSEARCAETNFTRATLTGCSVYGISARNVNLEGAAQKDLYLTPRGDHNALTVDDLEVAQLLYLLLHSAKIRHIIGPLTSAVVLILGQFTPERKVVLEALSAALRQHEPPYVPLLFDVERPSDPTATERATLLAAMVRFIIADLTEPANLSQVLEAIVPHVQVPVQPLVAQVDRPDTMFNEYGQYSWVLKPYRYADQDRFIAVIEDQIIVPAEAKRKELRAMRQANETDVD